MITPNDVLALADELANERSEVSGRSAVSRAYYSAFHEVRLLMEDVCGVVLPIAGEAHKKLQFCLDGSSSSWLSELADRLQSLRDERNRADYRLTESRFSNPITVQAQRQVAKDIVKAAQAAAAHLAKYRDDIRRHARQVLKLRVRNIPE